MPLLRVFGGRRRGTITLPSPVHAGSLNTTSAMLARFRRWRRAVSTAGAVTVMILAAACTPTSTEQQAPAPAATTLSAAPVPGTPGAGLEDVPRIAAQMRPSVVTILTPDGSGSGVIYSADGLIVTNEHVIRGNTEVQVEFADGRREPGTVKAADQISDLAIVQADRSDLPAARFQTKLPVVGSLAVVIGSPLGFEGSVAAGVISGLHRDIPGSAAVSQALVDLIQTDAPISPGNSGGALLNGEGEVIGINVAYIPPQAGAVALGFAIPAATVVDVVEQLQRTGRAQHAYAGLVPAAITPEIASQLGLKTTEGVLVAGVVAGGPAAEAGLRRGDIITAVNNEPTATPEDFLAVLRAHRPGDTVTITAHQPGESDRQLQLTLAERPRDTQ